MSSTIRLLLVLVLLFAGAGAEAQQNGQRNYRIVFPPGTTATVAADQIAGQDTVLYRLSAREGQRMTVALNAQGAQVYFNVYAPGRRPGDTALAVSSQPGRLVPRVNRFEADLPRSGDYLIWVYLDRAAARRGDGAGYSMSVSVTGGQQVTPPPVAAIPGTPERVPFLKVTGVRAGDQLNVRAGPSTGEPVIFRLPNDYVVRNLGCQQTQTGSAWCKISALGSLGGTGWASARYLVSATQPDRPKPQPQPPGGGGQYTVTGVLRCDIAQDTNDCRFGVIRRGQGDATLVIFRPGAPERRIEFRNFRPVSVNTQTGVYGERTNGTYVINVGQTERYVVALDALFGT